MLWQALVFTLHTTLPVFLLVVLGMLLRRIGIIDAQFVRSASRFVFTVSLPTLIFLSIVKSQVDWSAHFSLIVFAMLMGFLTIALALLAARYLGIRSEYWGEFVMSSFRSNFGVVGLSLCINTYGAQGALLGALLLAVVTPWYNLASVWVLSRGKGVNWTEQLWLIVKNPMIIAVFLALGFSALEWTLPSMLETTGQSVAAITLPLALIAVGGAISRAAWRHSGVMVWQISTLKLFVLPVVVVLLARLMGFEGAELGTMVLMFASPVAAAAFVMAQQSKDDASLTANAVVLSTMMSIFTLSLFVYTLRISGLI